ncbi:MAG: hypothetical protein ACTSV7_04380 [Candidatus Baldrarchaeia archaeon]
MSYSLEYLVNVTLKDVIPYISEIRWMQEKIEEILKKVSQINEFMAVLEEEIKREALTRKTDLKIFLTYFQKRVKSIASKERAERT